MEAWVVVVAAGRSERFGGRGPKLLVEHAGRPLLAHALRATDACPDIAGVVLVASDQVEQGWVAAGREGEKVRSVVRGGATRQGSVAAGLAAVPASISVVLVHDGARAFASPRLFSDIAAAAAVAGCAVPLLPVHDTVKRVEDGRVLGTVPREGLMLAQTPQGFRREVLSGAHDHASQHGIQATDDVALVELALAAGLLDGVSIRAVHGEEQNVKITRPDDLPTCRVTRVGLGHDIHPLVPGRKLVLAGVDLQAGMPDSERIGPSGHSDGDALVHATCDALLGACGLGDIGQWFPDTSPENAGRPSLEFLAAIRDHMVSEGWRPSSVSAVVKLERPKLAPHAFALRQAIAACLRIPVEAVGLSAKRGEGLGPVGEGRAIECDCIAVVERS